MHAHGGMGPSRENSPTPGPRGPCEGAFLWRNPWRLNIAKTITFSTNIRADSNEQSNNNDKTIKMADGCITIQHPEHIVKFSVKDDKVLMNKDGNESLSSEFIIDLNTLETKEGNEN